MALTKIKADGLTADLIDETKLADNSIDSEHYNDGSIDNAHLADDAVGIAELSATGTASSSTFLRGDNSWATVTSTTINNNADNKIITGSGTANTLEGEALAQIDSGGDLWIGHAPTTHYDNRKMFIHQPTAGETAYLSITGEQGAGIVFGDSVGQSTGNYESLIWHNNSDDSLKIATDNGDKGIKIENGGDVEVIDGNVKFASGHGINFNATSDASGTGVTAGSELFDDYEEGNWTPAWSLTTANYGPNYTHQQGAYTKIGRLVTIYFSIYSTSLNGSTGSIRVGGLPFTASTSPVSYPATAGAFPIFGFNSWTGEYIAMQVVGDVIELYGVQKNNTSYSDITHGEVNGGGNLYLKGTLMYNV